MVYRRIPCTFMRGGTSKALVFRRTDLPADPSEWPALFLAAMGSPDPSGRQLDGMGGGVSSLSKVCVVGAPSRPDADLDYSFFQIGIKDNVVDTSGNCGNMSSAMGPFALDEGIAPPPCGSGMATVRIHNTNTSKIIVSRFPVQDGRAAVSGLQSIDGVAGTGAPIRLEFLDPGGAGTGRLLPAGEPETDLKVSGLGTIRATMIDAANPCVFIDAVAIGRSGTELPSTLDEDRQVLESLEAIRSSAAVAMGIAPNMDAAARIPSIPKVAIVSRPTDYVTISGGNIGRNGHEISVRMISMGIPHRAVPLTGALCLAVAVRTPGTLPNRLASPRMGSIRIGHPSGTLEVDAEVSERDGHPHAVYGAVYRTARRLFEGHVLVPK